MKKLCVFSIFALHSLFFTTTVKADDFSIYTKGLEQCEKDQQIMLDTAMAEDGIMSTQEMLSSIYSQNDCYKAIAHQVIDKYYSNHAQTLKDNLANYKKTSNEIASDIANSHDKCRENCGTIMVVVGATNASQHYKRMIEELIEFAETMND